MRKVFTTTNSRDQKIKNFKVVANALLVYFENGQIEILYTKDALSVGNKRPNSPIFTRDLKTMQTVQADHPIDNYRYIATARTQTNCLLMHTGQNDQNKQILVLEDYIPLPAYKAPVEDEQDMEELFENLRTPMFFLVFIGVILVQLFWKNSKFNSDKRKAEESMGPLERSLRGRGPNGKMLSSRQQKEVRELDEMLGGMGNMANDMVDNFGKKFN